MTSYPLYIWYHIHYVWQHNIVCCWYHTQHMCDIICTTDDITYTLTHQTTVFMMSHPLRAWHHNHRIKHRTHCVFVITTSPMISYPLFFDIIPTICVTSYELYITSYPMLMSSHYCNYDITASVYETTSNMRATYTLNMWHHSHYLCHHTHCIDNITPTICATSYALYISSYPLLM